MRPAVGTRALPSHCLAALRCPTGGGELEVCLHHEPLLRVHLFLTFGFSVAFRLQGIHVVSAVLCHFDILQLRALRFVAVRRTAMLGSWGRG